MDFLRGDIVSHIETEISGEVIGFCPGTRWIRVKTAEGRKRIWLKEHLKLDSRPVVEMPPAIEAICVEPTALKRNPNAAPQGQLRVIGIIVKTDSEFELGVFDELRDAMACASRNSSAKIAAAVYDDEGQYVATYGPAGYFGAGVSSPGEPQ